jgi:hypothetical protein
MSVFGAVGVLCNEGNVAVTLGTSDLSGIEPLALLLHETTKKIAIIISENKGKVFVFINTDPDYLSL